jgi:hypothetical protein
MARSALALVDENIVKYLFNSTTDNARKFIFNMIDSLDEEDQVNISLLWGQSGMRREK